MAVVSTVSLPQSLIPDSQLSICALVSSIGEFEKARVVELAVLERSWGNDGT